MFLNGYPYTDFHEMNLDFLLKSMEELKKAFASFTASNSLIFAEPMLHDLTSTYAKNTIVLDPDGNAYISLQNVPVGVQLSNADYWLMVFNFEEYTEKANKNFTVNYFRDTTRAPYALAVGDWCVLDDVLYTVTQAIAADVLLVPGTNLTHFTVEQFLKDFVTSINQTVLQYKNDIDASELAYRQQLAQDIANTTASLQAQLDLAISGATVDSEVINARLGADGVTYATLGDAIRTQIDDINDLNGLCKPISAGDWLNGYRLNTSGTTFPAPTTNIYHRCVVLTCKEGDKFILNVNANSYLSFKAWVFADANDDIIETAPTLGQITDYVITAPKGAVKLGINDYDANSTWSGICYQNISVLDRIVSVEDNALVFRGAVTDSDYSNSLANITDVGIYYISSTQVFNDAPTLVYGNAAASMTVTLYASTLAQQEYINAQGENFVRLVVISSNTPVTSGGIPCDANGWYRKSDFKYSMFKGSLLAADHSNLLSDVIEYGAYYISGAQAFTDRPTDLTPNLGVVMFVLPFASTLTLQTYFDARGDHRSRIITNSTKTPYTTSLNADANGWFKTIFTRWQNKRIAFFGDSRTWYDGQNYTSNCKPALIGTPCTGYQAQVRSLLDTFTLNEGVSGDTSIDICTRIRNYNFTGVDAVFLEGGVNDFIASPAPSAGALAPIGSTFDTSTIYGAWQSAIEYIMINYPEVKIFIDIPAIGWKNTNTVYPYETAKIKQEVAELYNLPVLDLYKTAGINVLNRDTFYADDVDNTGWYLHFNDFGNFVIGQMIAEYINSK